MASEPYPDPTQFDPKSRYHDPRSDPEDPRWWLVDVQAVEALPRFLGLPELRETPSVASMGLLKRGNRLSVQPVTAAEWKAIRALARRKPR